MAAGAAGGILAPVPKVAVSGVSGKPVLAPTPRRRETEDPAPDLVVDTSVANLRSVQVSLQVLKSQVLDSKVLVT